MTSESRKEAKSGDLRAKSTGFRARLGAKGGETGKSEKSSRYFYPKEAVSGPRVINTWLLRKRFTIDRASTLNV